MHWFIIVTFAFAHGTVDLRANKPFDDEETCRAEMSSAMAQVQEMLHEGKIPLLRDKQGELSADCQQIETGEPV
jgi:hypothetical protein